MTRWFVGLLLVLVLSGLVAGEEIVMDAADMDKEGNVLEFPAVRLVVDNSGGATPLTEVRFTVTPHSTIGWSFNPIRTEDSLAWDSPENPWATMNEPPNEVIVGTSRYSLGILIYQDNEYNRNLGIANTIEPFIVEYYLPGHPNYNPEWSPGDNSQLLGNIIPAKVTFDVAYQITSMYGRPELFSTAEGSLKVDGVTVSLSDGDPLPQLAMVPEAMTMSHLLAGGMALVWAGRRKA